jgi:hypothetical protein
VLGVIGFDLQIGDPGEITDSRSKRGGERSLVGENEKGDPLSSDLTVLEDPDGQPRFLNDPNC